MPIWGVDSVTSATSERVWEAGHGQETLFEFVARKLGEPPYFWGRYLRRSGSSMLTESERDYIHSQRSPSGETVRILPIYNDWIALDRRHAQQDLRAIRRQPNASALAYQYGGDDCRSALEIARRLIPETERSGVRIYYDLEGWDFPPEWLRGWWDVMRSSEFKGIGGLYGRGVERARGASRSVRIQDVDPEEASHPLPYVPGGPPRYSRSGWSNIIPTALDQQFDRWVLEPLAESGSAAPLPQICVWSNTPRSDCRRGPRIEQEFRGLGPAEAHVLVWQYQFACFERSLREGEDPDTLRPAAFDMDLATEEGYGDMW